MRVFLLILQFMTRIPVKKNLDVTREDFARGAIYFPIIGLIIGFVVAGSIYISNMIFSPYLTALIGVIVHTFITGAIHLDGFSDTCDGIFSGRSKERILEIMKDSRLGTFGGVGLILLILLKWTLYFETINMLKVKSMWLYPLFIVVLLAPVVARSIVLFFMYKRKYARENEGLGDLFIGKISIRELFINQVFMAIIVSSISYKIMLIYVLTLLVMICFRKYIEGILNGITGDILGCSIEISEVVFMILSLGVINVLWN
ncbi:adenosylcobinamide-GDP ribazoletransferase [Clostridium cylindrosporum]|uniref:Adenosylcobinamide-GDP ribazoletransferase n=1 Tax=Clostridium cylindrosporum DSM 605 TaxID=1121307 RepID=A0A0J8D432_CLOCY|nr:adenosylcobinamide-GDP ribazoletransferase [Clostridium cylindrosporum]KMT20935.1 cobalamin synthase CobS [Clostridium cylindrosporum DSM 605]